MVSHLVCQTSQRSTIPPDSHQSFIRSFVSFSDLGDDLKHFSLAIIFLGLGHFVMISLVSHPLYVSSLDYSVL